MDVYARFSPLIGGPSFLPIHVEIMLHAPSQNIKVERDLVSGIENEINSTDFEGKDCEYLYRFDFLPSNPKDPTTIQRLISLQGVPGKVR